MSRTKKINVLVTGVGAIIGYGVIKSLKKSDLDVHIIGMDIYSDAVGQYWCDSFIQAIYAVDPGYIQFLKKIIHDNQIDIVFFGTEQEINRCVTDKEELGEDYKKLVLNRPSIYELTNDKWLTREFLLAHNMDNLAIPSVIAGDYDAISAKFGHEFILKPRKSYASKGIHKVDNAIDFAFYKEKMRDGFMAQRLIGDNEHEYTVGVFGLGDGTYSGYIGMKRKLSQEGATAKAEVYDDAALKQAIDALCIALKPIGPTNFQFRSEDGHYYLLEVNPRISSSTSIRMAMGYNEAEMCVRYFVNHEIIRPRVRKGRAVRFIDEVVVFDE